MPGLGSDGPFEFMVEPHNDQYHPDDERWRDQVTTLYTELHANVDTVRRGLPVEGAKGTVDQLVVAVGTAGAFSAVVSCFRAWLQRDRSRCIEVRWDENGVERSVTMTGDVDVESVREIARAAAHRVGGAVWQASTGPS
jgi:hypothetical protein